MIGPSFGPAVNAVFDADVLFQAAPARLLLGAAQAGLFRARWTDRIVDEVRPGSGERGGFLTSVVARW